MADEQNTGSNLFSYIGEEELKHFLDWMVRLCSKKYMPIDGVLSRAENATTADKLASPVLINGQRFDGTQDITFDEYAKKEDVIKKTDFARVGAEDNANKVVTLNSLNKIDTDFIDIQSIENSVSTMVTELDTKLNGHIQDNADAINGIMATILNDKTNLTEQIIGLISPMLTKNIDAIINFVTPRQIKSKVNISDETILPVYITNDNLTCEKFCSYPVEVLKKIRTDKTLVLNYEDLQYGKGNSNILATSDMIRVKPRDYPMIVNKSHYEDDSITRENFNQHKEAWASPKILKADGITSYCWLTKPLNSKVLEKDFSLNLYHPKHDFHYGIVIGDDVYYISDESKLTIGATMSGEENEGTEALGVFRQSPVNMVLTKEMIMDPDVPKNNGIMIAVIIDGEESLEPFDLSYSFVENDGYTVVPFKTIQFFPEIDTLGKFVPQYRCDDESEIRFCVNFFDRQTNNNVYSVWDETAKAWTEITDLSSIATSGLPIQKLNDIPPSAWDTSTGFSFIFWLHPKKAESICELGKIQISYTIPLMMEKAIYGIDYKYAYSHNKLIVGFYTSGEYLVNYPVSDSFKIEEDTNPNDSSSSKPENHDPENSESETQSPNDPGSHEPEMPSSDKPGQPSDPSEPTESENTEPENQEAPEENENTEPDTP